MADGFSINLDELRQHANTVSTISNQVNQASNAAQSALHGNAYGVIGQFFAAALMSACGQTGQSIMQAAKSLADIESGLKSVAQLYQQIDQARASMFSSTGGGTK
jgi:uncharacterized protein YukE